MSSILRALRRLESDARTREDDGATLHENVVFHPADNRSGGRALTAAGALLVVVACSVGLLFAASRWLSPTGGGDESGASLPAPATRALPGPPNPGLRAVAPQTPAPSRVVVASVPSEHAMVPRPRVPVATVEAPPAARPAPRVAAAPPLAERRPAKAAATRAREALEAHGRGAPVGVERILWHPSAEKRRAWLVVDGDEAAREVREGEQVGRYAVTRIDAGSVLFRSGKIEVRYKLGGNGP